VSSAFATPFSAGPLVVAVDGPSGSGKSTVSRAVARALGLRYLDTGAMYRALTWWLLEQGIDPADEAAVANAAGTPTIEPVTDPDAPAITVNGVDVSGRIRSPDVTASVSLVAAVPEVRALMLDRQRAAIGAGRIVVEGRDIGTVVAPRAAVKVFLTAHADARAHRRSLELEHADDVATTREQLARRDSLDSGRTHSPLAQAADAVELDSTELAVDEVVAAILALVEARTGLRPVQRS